MEINEFLIGQGASILQEVSRQTNQTAEQLFEVPGFETKFRQLLDDPFNLGIKVSILCLFWSLQQTENPIFD